MIQFKIKIAIFAAMKKQNNPLILHIDTATEVCSIALSHGAEILAVEESRDGNSHARRLIPFIENVLTEAVVSKKELASIALSIGPGSYTGLRIGASTAKGLCYSLDLPLVTISTLEIIMAGARKEVLAGKIDIVGISDYYFCPMIDARRMEVFTTLYDSTGNIVEEVHSQIIDETSFVDILQAKTVIFCGNGMPKCREMLAKNRNARFSEAPLSAVNMLEKALLKYQNGQFENVAYFEPFYLKEFIVAKPVVKGLN
jgi:tRNA threonylcarbamoyladenosine biosynthesis protein TsaB